MDAITVNGIVLSAMPVGEYDRRIVLLTARYGRISAFVRGARRQNSPLIAAARPFVTGEFRLYQGRDSYTVQSVSVREYFEKLNQDVAGMAYGCYFMEAAGYYSEENAESTELMNLLYLSLKALENPALSDRLVRIIYEFRLMVTAGEYPQIFRCRSCQKPLKDGWLSVKNGCCSCSACRGIGKDSSEIYLSPSVMYTLQFVFSSPLNRLYTFQLSSEIENTLWEIYGRWRAHYPAREFRSLTVLEELLQMFDRRL